MNGKRIPGWLFIFAILWIVMILFSGLFSDSKIRLESSEIKAHFLSGKVRKITFVPEASNGGVVAWEESAGGNSKQITKFVSRTAGQTQWDELYKLADEKGIPFKTADPPNPLVGFVLTGILFLGMPILFFLFIMKKQSEQVSGRGGPFGIGQTKARLVIRNGGQKTFADVAGCDEAKEELQEIVEFLKNPAKFQRLGGRIPKGVLLYGQPGTGKTLLAKAVAGEANVSFFSGSGSEFVEMFVGVGAARVRDLFNQARKHRPAVIFIDELDAVGRHRFAGVGGGHDEREQTLNQILVELDGFDTQEGIILIAATNRPDVLDPALLRPGRFDRRVQVPIPDVRGREQILKVHGRGKTFAGDVNLPLIARQTPGFTGADLENLLNEAALLAARRNKSAISQSELEEAIQRVVAGTENRVRLISPKEKKVIAYHEAGHTLVAKLTPDADLVHKVTIVSRGQALGYTLQLPSEDKVLHSKKELLSRVGILLGGRVAEELQFKEITGGACNDLEKATKLVRNMITRLGMGNKLSVFSEEEVVNRLMQGQDAPRYSQHYLKEIDLEVEEVIQGVKKQVIELLRANEKKLTALAEALLAEETLDSARIDEIINSS